jgi:hypothetical protein
VSGREPPGEPKSQLPRFWFVILAAVLALVGVARFAAAQTPPPCATPPISSNQRSVSDCLQIGRLT